MTRYTIDNAFAFTTPRLFTPSLTPHILIYVSNVAVLGHPSRFEELFPSHTHIGKETGVVHCSRQVPVPEKASTTTKPPTRPSPGEGSVRNGKRKASGEPADDKSPVSDLAMDVDPQAAQSTSQNSTKRVRSKRTKILGLQKSTTVRSFPSKPPAFVPTTQYPDVTAEETPSKDKRMVKYRWSHPSQRPHGETLPVQCPTCYSVWPWHSQSQRVGNDLVFY